MDNCTVPHRAAVHSIDHFALNVPSIGEARHFFESFGLDVSEVQGEAAALELRAGDRHRWARIFTSDRKSLAYLSFNCFASDLAAIKSQVEKTGSIAAAPHPNAVGDKADNFWFIDLDGNLIQVRVGPKTTPTAKAAVTMTSTPPDTRGSCTRSAVAPVRPARMSHVLLFTPDTLRAVDFYERSIGLRLSDKSVDIIAFTHGAHGSDHHLLAFAKSSAKGWHHVAWDVPTVEEVGIGASQMAAAGYKAGWGTGRHVLGSNYFHYVQDPWGSFSEYSADIDFVSSERPWISGDFPPEDSLYLWGPDVPDNFIVNTEA